MVANPARGQLVFSLSPFAPENLVLRDGFYSSSVASPARHLNKEN